MSIPPRGLLCCQDRKLTDQCSLSIEVHILKKFLSQLLLNKLNSPLQNLSSLKEFYINLRNTFLPMCPSTLFLCPIRI